MCSKTSSYKENEGFKILYKIPNVSTSEYSGISTMDLTTHSDFSIVKEIRSQREAASIMGRDDMRLLLSKKVLNKEI